MTRYWTETHPEPFRRGVQRLHPLLRDADRRARVRVRQRLRLQDRAAGRAGGDPGALPARRGGLRRSKLWREQLGDWDETFKPASIATHRELQAVDPDALSDEELVAYLTRCRDHHSAMISQHMRFTGGGDGSDR